MRKSADAKLGDTTQIRNVIPERLRPIYDAALGKNTDALTEIPKDKRDEELSYNNLKGTVFQLIAYTGDEETSNWLIEKAFVRPVNIAVAAVAGKHFDYADELIAQHKIYHDYIIHPAVACGHLDYANKLIICSDSRSAAIRSALSYGYSQYARKWIEEGLLAGDIDDHSIFNDFMNALFLSKTSITDTDRKHFEALCILKPQQLRTFFPYFGRQNVTISDEIKNKLLAMSQLMHNRESPQTYIQAYTQICLLNDPSNRGLIILLPVFYDNTEKPLPEYLKILPKTLYCLIISYLMTQPFSDKELKQISEIVSLSDAKGSASSGNNPRALFGGGNSEAVQSPVAESNEGNKESPSPK